MNDMRSWEPDQHTIFLTMEEWAELLTMLNDGYRTVPMCCGASPRMWITVRWPKLFPWGWG